MKATTQNNHTMEIGTNGNHKVAFYHKDSKPLAVRWYSDKVVDVDIIKDWLVYTSQSDKES